VIDRYQLYRMHKHDITMVVQFGPMIQKNTHIKPCADAFNQHNTTQPVRYVGYSTDINELLLKKAKYLTDGTVTSVNAIVDDLLLF